MDKKKESKPDITSMFGDLAKSLSKIPNLDCWWSDFQAHDFGECITAAGVSNYAKKNLMFRAIRDKKELKMIESDLNPTFELKILELSLPIDNLYKVFGFCHNDDIVQNEYIYIGDNSCIVLIQNISDDYEGCDVISNYIEAITLNQKLFKSLQDIISKANSLHETLRNANE